MSEQKAQTNAADEGQVKQAKESVKDRELRRRNAWLKAMHDEEIGRLLIELIDALHTDESPVVAGDQAETHRRIGYQGAGRAIRKHMKGADRKRFYELELKYGEDK